MCLEISVKKHFRDFDLDVEWSSGNELVALFGYSGSGKTVTLKTIAGISDPDSGRICLDGRTLFDSGSGINERPQNRGTGYVFQDHALFPHLTVEQNIAYGLRGISRKGVSYRVSEMIDLFHLGGFEKKYPATLSGGQKQRVSFARALAVKPSLMLLDEPFSALDSMIRMEMRSVLKNIQKTFGIPVVLVTHDFPEALEVADRMIVYSEGRIQQTGTPSGIFRTPANEKVSELLVCWKNRKCLESGTDGILISSSSVNAIHAA